MSVPAVMLSATLSSVFPNGDANSTVTIISNKMSNGRRDCRDCRDCQEVTVSITLST
jgi:hypothetical protein